MKTTKLAQAAGLTAALLLCACDAPVPTPMPTAVGTSQGAPAATPIGPTGGTASSADGRLSVVIPPGALADTTSITVEPLSNEAFGGVGAAYRLGPAGLTFAQPAQLVFHYTDEDVAGSVPDALAVLVQTVEGYWEALEGATLDDAARTVTAPTLHFSDYSLIEGFQLVPATATVKTGATLPIRLTWCLDVTKAGAQPRRGFPCSPASLRIGTGKWAVNGVSGGTASTGTVGGGAAEASYVAPATKPNPDTVAVSTEVSYASTGLPKKLVLISHVTVATSPTHYTGTVQFDLLNASGTAYVEDWAQFEDLGDTRRYLPTGTMVIDFHVDGCAPLHQQFPLSTSTPDTPHETLVIYTESNVAFPRQHQFSLAGDGTVTLMCGGPPATAVTYQVASLTGMVVGPCPGTGVAVPYTDENELTGSFSCPDSNENSITWDFLAH